ncbi:SMI1/KNR4 family protein [Nonomuraea sp. NPDC050643]|uniref:SMI1/KNR4 family protein n=1 Tax=Nonomuraea sp. NPDC050643 TaxID=3155660 RepID=UPI0033EDDA2D
MSVVGEAWGRIEEWLERHAPSSAAVLAPPADPREIAAAQATLGLAFPAELVESLRRHDGLLEWANVLPEHPPLSVAQIVEHRQMCMDVAESVDGFTPPGPGQEPWWHELWLPFAGCDGDAQVIDLRPGPGYARLGWTVHDNGGHFDGAWPCLGAYLAETADALADRLPVNGWHAYLTVDGDLWWSTAGQVELNGTPLRHAP